MTHYGHFSAFDYVPEDVVRQVYFRLVLVLVQARDSSAVVWVLAVQTVLVSAILVVYGRRMKVLMLGEICACRAGSRSRSEYAKGRRKIYDETQSS